MRFIVTFNDASRVEACLVLAGFAPPGPEELDVFTAYSSGHASGASRVRSPARAASSGGSPSLSIHRRGEPRRTAVYVATEAHNE